MRGGSSCRGLPEFPLNAEAILCKVAASSPLRFRCSRIDTLVVDLHDLHFQAVLIGPPGFFVEKPKNGQPF